MRDTPLGYFFHLILVSETDSESFFCHDLSVFVHLLLFVLQWPEEGAQGRPPNVLVQVGLSDRMDSYEPWGSDYYIIRSDLFVTDPQTAVEGNRDSDGDDDEESRLLYIVISVLCA